MTSQVQGSSEVHDVRKGADFFLLLLRFTVNFLRGNDIALHINPRFNDAGRPTLGRNSKVGERWGKEERDQIGRAHV